MVTSLFAGQPGSPASSLASEPRGQVGHRNHCGLVLGVSDNWHLSSHTEQPLEERSDQVCGKAQQMAYYEGFRGGKCVHRARCLPREERAEQRAVSSRRGVKAAFRVQEQGEEGVLHVLRVFLWDQNCLHDNVPAPVGWCGFACCSVLPEKLLIYHS